MGMSVDCFLSITDDFATCYVANSRCSLTKVNLEFGFFSLLYCHLIPWQSIFLLVLSPLLPGIENYLYKIPCFPSVTLVSRINFPNWGFVLSHEQPIRIWMQPCISSNSCLVLLTSLPVHFPELDFQAFPSQMNSPAAPVHGNGASWWTFNRAGSIKSILCTSLLPGAALPQRNCPKVSEVSL